MKALELQKKAARSDASKATLRNMVAKAKKNLKKLEDKAENAAENEQSTEEANKEQQKNDAEKAVSKTRKVVNDDESKLKRLKDLVKGANSEEVVKLSNQISALITKMRAAKKKSQIAEKNEAKVLNQQASGDSDDQKMMAEMKAQKKHIENEKAKKAQQLRQTKRPEDVQRLQDEIKALDAKHKQILNNMAAEKKVVKMEKRSAQSARANKVIKKPQKKFTSDPAVQKTRNDRAKAEIKQQAAASAVKETTKSKLIEAKDRADELVQRDELEAKKKSKQARELARKVEVKGEKIKERQTEAFKLKLLKRNILTGKPYHSGFNTTKDKLAALPLLPPRSAKTKAAKLTLLNETQPTSGVCPKGKSCCIVAFADAGCRLQAGEFCSSGTNSAAGNWKALMDTKMSVGNAKSISLEVRWVKDESQSANNGDEVLRLRACGEFSNSGSGCYPKEGAGLRFGSYYNTPAGQCVMTEDMAQVSGYKLKGALVSMVEVTSSQNSAEGKADAARQKNDAQADASARQKINLDKAVAQPKGVETSQALVDLVMELLEANEGDYTASVPDLLSLGGSFQLTMKDTK